MIIIIIYNIIMYILNLPLEILHIIFSYLNLLDQINFRDTCKLFRKFDIIDFWNLGNTIKSYQITNNILSKYPKIKYLNLYDNNMVYDINFLKDIEILNIGGLCTISDKDISNVNKLIFLCAENNFRIKNLKNKNKIRYLIASGSCNISDDDISHLDLYYLDSKFNNKITIKIIEKNTNFLKYIRYL